MCVVESTVRTHGSRGVELFLRMVRESFGTVEPLRAEYEQYVAALWQDGLWLQHFELDSMMSRMKEVLLLPPEPRKSEEVIQALMQFGRKALQGSRGVGDRIALHREPDDLRGCVVIPMG